MVVLFLTDRLSRRGGADLHLRQVVAASVERGDQVILAYGRADDGVRPPTGADAVRVRGLAPRTHVRAGLRRLPELLSSSDLVHVQNVMNPAALEAAATTGRTVVTVQDHRFFCPGPGRTLPDGSRCRSRMSDAACRSCLPDTGYRERMLELTRRRLDALAGTRIVVLSRYMADELEAAGVPGAAVVPPWVESGPPRREPGDAFLLAGRLVWHKDVASAHRAWTDAGRPLPLRVAGAGPFARTLDDTDRLGWLDAGAFHDQLDRARALLFPARWQEPFGIAGVEALAHGTPVVVADVGGTRDWSDAGCVRVAAGDTAAMTSAIRHLADDPAAAARLGEQGRAAVTRRFARARIEPMLSAVHDAVAGRDRSCGAPPPPRRPRVVAVMPAYNAARTLEACVADIPGACVDEVLLVDDASHDETVAVARRLGLTVHRHERNRGYGGNQKTCYTRALDDGADVVVMVHPDHQYDPRIIPDLVTPLLEGRCDAVFGSRILGGRTREGGMPVWKYAANVALTAVENAVLRAHLTEYHSGFRAYSRRYLEAVRFTENSDDFVFDSEIIAQGVLAGMRIEEVPISTRYFDEASEIGVIASVRYGLAILRLLARFVLHARGVRRDDALVPRPGIGSSVA